MNGYNLQQDDMPAALFALKIAYPDLYIIAMAKQEPESKSGKSLIVRCFLFLSIEFLLKVCFSHKS